MRHRHSCLTAQVSRVVLDNRQRKARFILAALVPSAVFTLKAAQIGLASIYERSQSPYRLQRAVLLDPANPEAYHRLGQTILYRFASSNEGDGLADLRKAVALGPQRTLYWLDLALACVSAGDRTCAATGFDQALRLSPLRPRVHWLAANYELTGGRTAEALSELGSTLRLSPEYSMPVFELCSRAHVDPDTVNRLVLPDDQDPKLRLQYAGFLVNQDQPVASANVWKAAVAGRHPFPFSLAEPYVDGLIARKQFSQAFAAWQDLERINVIGNSVQGDSGSIFNGGFEQDPLNAGFDWRYGQPPYVSLSFADSRAYQGRKCLRLDFLAGQNEDSEPVYQLVLVRPNQPYILTAFVRSERVTSDSGPRLRVVDAASPPDLDAVSETTLGTTPWHVVQLAFVTGPRTEAVQICVWRPRSRTFPGQISGTVWIDGLSLKPVRPRSG